MGEDVEAITVDGAALHFPLKMRAQPGESVQQALSDRCFVVRHRLYIHELARKLENVGHALYSR
jgi:hypothetical protein